MPGVGWVPADPCLSEMNDPTGDYIYYLGAMPNLNDRTAINLGGDIILPGYQVTKGNTILQSSMWRAWPGTLGEGWYVKTPNDYAGAAINGTFVLYKPSVVGGKDAVASFELSDMPQEDTTVTFSSTDPSVLTVLSPEMKISTKSRSVDVSMATARVTTATKVTLTAKFNGETRTTELTILPYQLHFVATQRYIAPGMPIPFKIDFERRLSKAITVQVTTLPSNGAPVTITVPAKSQGVINVIAPPANSMTSMVGLEAKILDGGMATDSVLVAGR